MVEIIIQKRVSKYASQDYFICPERNLSWTQWQRHTQKYTHHQTQIQTPHAA